MKGERLKPMIYKIELKKKFERKFMWKEEVKVDVR